MQRRELELCVETLQACRAAVDGGADRIELCAALDEGGVTPSHALIEAAVASSSLPVHALIRPRAGNFVYSDAEFAVLCKDTEHAMMLGARGIVVGVLTSSHEIDRIRLADLVRRAHGLPVTFHRAIDRTPDLLESLEIVADLGCSRILTSGGEPTVMEGIATLERLARQAAGRLRVAAGGGVRLINAPQLMKIPSLDLHASLLKKAPLESVADPLWHDDVSGRDPSADAVRDLSAIVHGAG